MDPLEVNGEQPRIEGQHCEELLALEFWHAGELQESANQLYLKFAGQWHRLYFDYGIVFWRSNQEAPVDYYAEEIQSEFKLRDIGSCHSVRGTTLEEIRTAAVPGGSRVELRFQGGKSVAVACIDDRSEVAW